MPPYVPLTDDIRLQITECVGPQSVVADPKQIDTYRRDASDLSCAPEMVVTVQSAAQIQQLLKLANALRFPVIPRGGGTGLAGGCLPMGGGVVMSLEKMNRIRAIDTANLIAEVEPGVITHHLRQAARREGLFYPPDPAGMDRSTIGGNAATNAGGPACVKYGTTKNYILGLEAVLPNGEPIVAGVKTRKGVVGYDLTQLLVGSEGTLGVITALTLKLIPHPAAVSGCAALFADMHAAMAAVSHIMIRGHLPSAIEFMDHRCLHLVADLLPFDLPDDKASLLLIETDGVQAQIQREIDVIAGLCRDMGAVRLLPAPDPAERERIWAVRRQISLRIQENADIYFPEDIAVPIGRIAEFIDTLPRIEADYDVTAYAFGHAGDGNIHVSLCAERTKNPRRVEAGVTAVFDLALQMGGTISGEHGIGEAKKKFLPMELSSESIRLQRGIKRLFDPHLILNPGKIFPD